MPGSFTAVGYSLTISVVAAARNFKLRTTRAPKSKKDPRAFSISPDLVLELIVMRINLRMSPAAIEAGNTLIAGMLKAKHVRDDKPVCRYTDYFLVCGRLDVGRRSCCHRRKPLAAFRISTSISELTRASRNSLGTRRSAWLPRNEATKSST